MENCLQQMCNKLRKGGQKILITKILYTTMEFTLIREINYYFQWLALINLFDLTINYLMDHSSVEILVQNQ